MSLVSVEFLTPCLPIAIGTAGQAQRPLPTDSYRHGGTSKGGNHRVTICLPIAIGTARQAQRHFLVYANFNLTAFPETNTIQNTYALQRFQPQ